MDDQKISWEAVCIEGKHYTKIFHLSNDIAVFTPLDLDVDILNNNNVKEKQDDSFILTFENDIFYNVLKKRIAKQLEISSALKELNVPWILKPDFRNEMCKMLCGGVKKQKLKPVKVDSNTFTQKKNATELKSKHEKNKKKKHVDSEDEEEEEEEEEFAEEDELEEEENEEEMEEDAEEDLENEEDDAVVVELENEEEEDDEEDEEEFAIE
jgi:hypothetical protein